MAYKGKSNPGAIYVVDGTEEGFTSGDEAQAYAVIQRIHNEMSGGAGRPPAVYRIRVDSVDLTRAVESVLDYATENDLEWFSKVMDLEDVDPAEREDVEYDEDWLEHEEMDLTDDHDEDLDEE